MSQYSDVLVLERSQIPTHIFPASSYRLIVPRFLHARAHTHACAGKKPKTQPNYNDNIGLAPRGCEKAHTETSK